MGSPVSVLPVPYESDGLDNVGVNGQQPEQAAQPKPRHPQRQQKREQRRLDHHCPTHKVFHRRSSLSSQKEMARIPPILQSLKMKGLRKLYLAHGVAQGTRCVKFYANVVT
jgi:hypothetical protein